MRVKQRLIARSLISLSGADANPLLRVAALLATGVSLRNALKRFLCRLPNVAVVVVQRVTERSMCAEISNPS